MNLESVAARGHRAGGETGCYPYENVARTPMATCLYAATAARRPCPVRLWPKPNLATDWISLMVIELGRFYELIMVTSVH